MYDPRPFGSAAFAAALAVLSATAAGASPSAAGASPSVEVSVGPGTDGRASTVLVRNMTLPYVSTIVKVKVRARGAGADTTLSTMYVTGTNRPGTHERSIRGTLEAPAAVVLSLEGDTAATATVCICDGGNTCTTSKAVPLTIVHRTAEPHP